MTEYKLPVYKFSGKYKLDDWGLIAIKSTINNIEANYKTCEETLARYTPKEMTRYGEQTKRGLVEKEVWYDEAMSEYKEMLRYLEGRSIV